MNTPRDVSYDEYVGASLADPQEAAAYLSAVMEMNDRPALLLALRQVAKAHGMVDVARRADVGDKSLFRALSATGNPTLETMGKVLLAMGLRLSVTPVAA